MRSLARAGPFALARGACRQGGFARCCRNTFSRPMSAGSQGELLQAELTLIAENQMVPGDSRALLGEDDYGCYAFRALRPTADIASGDAPPSWAMGLSCRVMKPSRHDQSQKTPIKAVRSIAMCTNLIGRSVMSSIAPATVGVPLAAFWCASMAQAMFLSWRPAQQGSHRMLVNSSMWKAMPQLGRAIPRTAPQAAWRGLCGPVQPLYYASANRPFYED